MRLHQAAIALNRGREAKSGPNNPGSTSPPPLSATYAYVWDSTNQWELYAKAATTTTPNDYAASLVKMMTVQIIYEKKYDVLYTESVTVESGDLVSGSAADLQAGDVLLWNDLIHGLMLPSGNDAAYCAARILGTEEYEAQGETGTTGVTRFVEMMNDKATDLGLTNTVFTSPSGVNDLGNQTCARDMALIGEAAFAVPYIEEVSGTPSFNMVITGANARQYVVYHTSGLINGPSVDHAGVKDARVMASKTGTLYVPLSACLCAKWQSPNGTILIAVVITADSEYDRYLDMRALLYAAEAEFPYLSYGVEFAPDPLLSDVVLLTGAEYGVIDESPVGRTITNQGGVSVVTTRPPIEAHEFSFDGTDDRLEVANAADLHPGSGDWCIECWVRGTGSEPGGTYPAILGKYSKTGNQREYGMTYDVTSNEIEGYVSSNGVSADAVKFPVGTNFWIGAPRHLALRRYGSLVSLYVNGEKQSEDDVDIGTDALFESTAAFLIGARANGGSGTYQDPLEGFIDEVRVTIGDARYTANMETIAARKFPRGDTEISTSSTTTEAPTTTTTEAPTTTTTTAAPTSSSTTTEAGPETVSFVSKGTRYLGTSATIVYTYPGSIQAGDELFLFVMHRDTLSNYTGWTVVGSKQNDGSSGTNQWLTVLRKTATGSESGTGNMTQASSQRYVTGMVCVRPSGGSISVINWVDSTYYTASADPGLHPIQGTQGDASGEIAFAASTCVYASATSFLDYDASTGWTIDFGDNEQANRLGVAHQDAPTGSTTSGTFTHDSAGTTHDGAEIAFTVKAS